MIDMNVAEYRLQEIKRITAKALKRVPMDAKEFADFISDYGAELVALERRVTAKRIREWAHENELLVLDVSQRELTDNPDEPAGFDGFGVFVADLDKKLDELEA